MSSADGCNRKVKETIVGTCYVWNKKNIYSHAHSVELAMRRETKSVEPAVVGISSNNPNKEQNKQTWPPYKTLTIQLHIQGMH